MKNNQANTNELELGKYLEADMIALTEDNVEGGWTPVIGVSIWISEQTCPSTACTRAC